LKVTNLITKTLVYWSFLWDGVFLNSNEKEQKAIIHEKFQFEAKSIYLLNCKT